jgi:hypothetical protein
MSQENLIRDGTSLEIPGKPLETEILIVMDDEHKSLQVAGNKNKVSKKGEPETVPFESKESEFLKIDGSSIVENFISNFLRQSKDPTYFRFFRIPLSAVKTARRLFKELLNNNPSREALAFAKKYEQDINNLKINQMDNNNESATQSAPERTTRYDAAMVDWKKLEDFGLSREYMERRKLMDDLLNGRKTGSLVPVKLSTESLNLTGDARMSLVPVEGQLTFRIHCIRKTPDLDTPYFGHAFTAEDRQHLKESGHMGRTAMMLPAGGTEKVPHFISIDRMTNELAAVRVDSVRIPTEILGVKLNEYEQNELREGRRIFVEDMYSKAKNKHFDSFLQVNAEKRGVDFVFEQNKGPRQEIGGVKLTQQQSDDLAAGKVIFVEDMKKKNSDENFSAFISQNDEGKLSYSRKNYDTGEFYIPEKIYGVQLLPDDREKLRQGGVVFLEDMVNSKNELFSCFIRPHPDNGSIQTSNSETGFNDRPAPKIPAEVYRHTFLASERGALQDGKAIHIKDFTGQDGSKFERWVKYNSNTGKVDFYSQNPDQKKESAGQQASQADSNRQGDKETKGQKQSSKKQNRPKL